MRPMSWPMQQMRVVDDLLKELELDKITCLKVFNKIDLIDSSEGENLARQYGAVTVSAIDPGTFSRFYEKVQQIILKRII